MSEITTTNEQSLLRKDEQGAGGPGCVENTGGYHELTAREFHGLKNLVVVVLKAPDATGCFEDFRGCIAAGSSDTVEPSLADWPSAQPIGLVCSDGECSGRLAVRLSKKGYRIYHLSGGLREWRNWNRC